MASRTGLLLLFAVVAVPSISVTRQFSPDHATRITLSSVGAKSGKFTLSYIIRSNGKDLTSKKELAPETARELADILLRSDPGFERWTRETSCFAPGYWKVSVAHQEFRVCRSRRERQILQDFQSAVAALFTGMSS